MLPVVTPVIWNIREFALVQSVNAEEGVRYELLVRVALQQNDRLPEE